MWQLFADSPAAMKAMVRLAAASPYLTGLLTQSPGMIDELIDSLLLGRLPSTDEVRETLRKWVAGQGLAEAAAEFKRSFQLRIAVRDVLRKSNPTEAARALSDVADAIAACAAENCDDSAEGDSDRDTPPLTLLAIGRWGDCGVGYRSPLTMLLLYDDAALPQPLGRRREARGRVDAVGRRLLRVLQRPFAAERMYAASLQWGRMEESDRLSLSMAELRHALTDPAEAVAAKLLLASARPLAGESSLADAAIQATEELRSVENRRAFAAYVDPLAAAETSERTMLRLTHELAFAVRHSDRFVDQRRGKVEDLLRGDEVAAATAALQKIDLTLQLASRAAADRLPRERDERGRVAYLLAAGSWDDVVDELRGIRATLQAAWREIAGIIGQPTVLPRS